MCEGCNNDTEIVLALRAIQEDGIPITGPVSVTFPTPQHVIVDSLPGSPAQENGNLLSIKNDADNILAKLDVALSTRASETTLAGLKTDVENLYARFDVALSTRAADLTLQATNTALATAKSTLNSMLAQLQNDKDLEETVWIDKTTQVFYIRRATLTESSGAVVISWTDTAGNPATPTVANLVQVSSSLNLKITSTGFRATASGTGYSTGDRILEIAIVNTDNGSVASSLWINTTTNTVIAAPTLANLKSEYEDALNTINTSITATNTKIDTLNASFGAPADTAATTDIGTFSFLSFIKRFLQKQTAISTQQTDGTQKSILRGGAKGATAAADITSTVEGTDHQAADVQLYHGGVAIDPRQIRALTASDVITETNSAAIKTGIQDIDLTTQATNVLLGPVTETAPTTDTASSGLNGRLQRIAQRLTSLSRFASTGANPSTLTVGTTAVVASASSITRKQSIFKNMSLTQIIYLGYGSGVTSANSAIPLLPGAMWIEDIYTGDIYAIASAAAASLNIQNCTA